MHTQFSVCCSVFVTKHRLTRMHQDWRWMERLERGGFFPPPLRISNHSDDLRHLDFNGLWFGFFTLGQMNFQNAVLELGVDLRAVGAVWQREAAEKVPVRALDPMILLVLLFLLELALAGDGEHPVFNRHLHLFLLHF